MLWRQQERGDGHCGRGCETGPAHPPERKPALFCTFGSRRDTGSRSCHRRQCASPQTTGDICQAISHSKPCSPRYWPLGSGPCTPPTTWRDSLHMGEGVLALGGSAVRETGSWSGCEGDTRRAGKRSSTSEQQSTPTEITRIECHGSAQDVIVGVGPGRRSSPDGGGHMGCDV